MDARVRLPIRDEPPPPGDWLVLRGGPHSTPTIRSSARRAKSKFNQLLVSVIIVSPPLVKPALRNYPLRRFRTVKWCLVRDVRDAGFLILPTFDSPHHSIAFALDDDLTIGVFTATLNNEMENPHAEPRR